MIGVDDHEAFHDLIDCFLTSVSAALEELHQAVAANNFVAIKRVAHTLKGSSSSMGIRSLPPICQALEQSAQLADMAAVEALVPLLIAGQTRVAAALEQFRHSS